MFKEYDYINTPVVEIVNAMLLDAIRLKASDIHFDPQSDSITVRIRIDGELIEYAKVPEAVKKNLSTRIKIIAGMNITEMRLPQDGAIKSLGTVENLDMRVSSLPITFGEKIVIRILDYDMSTSGLDSLGFLPGNLESIKKLIHLPNGIILVSGATGSGKSTTVYSMLQEVNTIERNIITVEDPVEMKVDGLNQVQTMSEIGLDFANTLRSILRQDPDIIMIGEIRDDETARIAVRASITGHLVLSTIHTNSALNTIERLLDMNIERYLLGSALSGILAQRLTKRLCPHCRIARQTTDFERTMFNLVAKKDVPTIYDPNTAGCEHCHKGYKGRIPLQEVLIMTQEIRDAITTNLSKTELRKMVFENDSIHSLLQDGLEKVSTGDTSMAEIMRVIDIEEDLKDESKELKDAFLGKSVSIMNQNTSVVNNETLTENTITEVPTSITETVDTMTEVTNAPIDETTVQPQAPIVPSENEIIVEEMPTPVEPFIDNNVQPTEYTNQNIATNEVIEQTITAPTPIVEPVVNQEMSVIENNITDNAIVNPVPNNEVIASEPIVVNPEVVATNEQVIPVQPIINEMPQVMDPNNVIVENSIMPQVNIENNNQTQPVITENELVENKKNTNPFKANKKIKKNKLVSELPVNPAAATNAEPLQQGMVLGGSLTLNPQPAENINAVNPQ